MPMYMPVCLAFSLMSKCLYLQERKNVQEFRWYAKLRAGGVKCTGMLEHIRTSAK